MLTKRFTGPIASAVAGEITRLKQHPDFPGEGVAYKAAWDRAGSDALKHCEAFRRDCVLSSAAITVRGAGGSWPRFMVHAQRAAA